MTPAPRVPTPASDYAVAVHEAAHACLGILFQLPVSRVAILAAAPDAPRGYVLADDASWSATAADAYVRDHFDQVPIITSKLPETLQMMAAGGIAERKLLGQRTDTAWHDELHMEALIGQALRRPPWSAPVQQFKRIIVAVTTERVGKHWDWITRVAEALLERGALTGDDVRQLRK